MLSPHQTISASLGKARGPGCLRPRLWVWDSRLRLSLVCSVPGERGSGKGAGGASTQDEKAEITNVRAVPVPVWLETALFRTGGLCFLKTHPRGTNRGHGAFGQQW